MTHNNSLPHLTKVFQYSYVPKSPPNQNGQNPELACDIENLQRNLLVELQQQTDPEGWGL